MKSLIKNKPESKIETIIKWNWGWNWNLLKISGVLTLPMVFCTSYTSLPVEVYVKHDLVSLTSFWCELFKLWTNIVYIALSEISEFSTWPVYIENTWNFTKRDSQNSYSSETAVIRPFQNKPIQKVCRIHKKTPIPDFLCTKLADPQHEYLLKARPQHKCFSVIFTKFLRHLFYRTPLGDYS